MICTIDGTRLTHAADPTASRDAENGLVTGTTLNTVTDSWTPNTYGEPGSYTASSASGDLYSVPYTSDDLRRITQKAETILGDQMTWDYVYDTAGRLTNSTLTTPGRSFPTSYAYDDNSNRLSKVGQFGTETGAYDAQDRMTTYGPCAYAYTANGELTTKTCGSEETTYQYDTLGNLTHVTMPDGIALDYVIDPAGRRVGKTVNGVLVSGFLYRDSLAPAAQLDGSGNIVDRFVYGTHRNVPDYVTTGGNTYRYITDQLGSVRLVVDASTGTVAQRLDYDGFGRIIRDTSPGFQPFGFAGGLYDPQTGLTRYGSRDYDPNTGRWLSKDPLGFAAPGTNFFGYVLGDPVNLYDQSGLCPACKPCDDCPSGRWSYFGGGGSFFVGIGITIGHGTFTCVGKPTMQVRVKGGCFGVGIILAAGIGAEGTLGFREATGCNSGDLLGAGKGLFAAIGPFSVTETWGEKGNFGGMLVGLGKSIGAGAAYLPLCYLSRR